MFAEGPYGAFTTLHRTRLNTLLVLRAAAQAGCEVYAVDASERVYRTPGMPVAV